MNSRNLVIKLDISFIDVVEKNKSFKTGSVKMKWPQLQRGTSWQHVAILT